MNSRITWPPNLESEYGNLANYLATLEKFLYSYEFAYYLVTLLKVRVRKSRALLGHFIKILILLGICALLDHLTLRQIPGSSRIIWPLYNNSYTPMNSRITWPVFSGKTSFFSRITWPLFSGQTWFNSRITWPPIKILILLWIRV